MRAKTLALLRAAGRLPGCIRDRCEVAGSRLQRREGRRSGLAVEEEGEIREGRDARAYHGCDLCVMRVVGVTRCAVIGVLQKYERRGSCWPGCWCVIRWRLLIRRARRVSRFVLLEDTGVVEDIVLSQTMIAHCCGTSLSRARSFTTLCSSKANLSWSITMLGKTIEVRRGSGTPWTKKENRPTERPVLGADAQRRDLVGSIQQPFEIWCFSRGSLKRQSLLDLDATTRSRI